MNLKNKDWKKYKNKKNDLKRLNLKKEEQG